MTRNVAAVRKSSKRIDISFDEWNVWYQTRFEDEDKIAASHWPMAPRLLEDKSRSSTPSSSATC